MSRLAFFGERTQRARVEHFCDWCCNWIQPGETYTRKVCISGDDLIIFKEHDRPACKMFDLRDDEIEEPVQMTLQTVIETKLVDKVALQQNGSPITRSEPVLVARTICVADSPEQSNCSVDYEDEEIPF